MDWGTDLWVSLTADTEEGKPLGRSQYKNIPLLSYLVRLVVLLIVFIHTHNVHGAVVFPQGPGLSNHETTAGVSL